VIHTNGAKHLDNTDFLWNFVENKQSSAAFFLIVTTKLNFCFIIVKLFDVFF